MLLEIRGRTLADADVPPPPTIKAEGAFIVRFQPRGWRLQVPCETGQAAQLISGAGLVLGREGRWVTIGDPDGRGVNVRTTGTPAELTELERLVIDDAEDAELERWETDDILLDVVLRDPTIGAMCAVTVDFGDSVVAVDPERMCIGAQAPVSETRVRAIAASGVDFSPVDDLLESMSAEGLHLGFIVKADRDEDDEPPADGALRTMLALERSMAHPTLMRPFPGTFDDIDEGSLRRVIVGTIDDDVEWLEDADDAMMAEFTGIPAENMEALTDAASACARQVVGALAVDGDVEPDADTVAMVSVTSLAAMVAGSRVMRSELHRDGCNTAPDTPVPARDISMLVAGMFAARDALHCLCGDRRAGRIWSLPLSAAVIAEGILRDCLFGDDDEPVDGADIILDGVYLAFDIGVRFQQLRLVPDLLSC